MNVKDMAEAKGYRLPGFVIKLMEKLLHQDFCNGYFAKGYEGVEFCTKALEYLDIKLNIEGLENIPSDGRRYTFASNHPLGGIDGVALASIVGNNGKREIKYFLNDFLMSVKGLAPIGVPISMTGGQSRNLPGLVNETFGSDCNILIFPAGICSRKINGEIRDIPWGKMFIRKSIETGRDIVPVHFLARNSDRFYRIANICRMLGFKFNFAMLFLPDEMYRAQHSEFTVRFGKPVPYTFFDGSRTAKEWALWMQEEVYRL